MNAKLQKVVTPFVKAVPAQYRMFATKGTRTESLYFTCASGLMAAARVMLKHGYAINWMLIP